MNQSDWELAGRIATAVSEVLEGVRATKPQRRIKGLSIDYLHDTRECVHELPKLAVVFSTSIGLRGGVQEFGPDYPFSHLLILPNFLFPKLNERIVSTQPLIHHELAHLLLGQKIDSDDVKKSGPEYFNDPQEIDAFFH